jgi:hypothetical protein
MKEEEVPNKTNTLQLSTSKPSQLQQTGLSTTAMAAVRLRRAFHYPEDSDGHEELDEEEQHQLIQQLQTQNDTRNGQYNVTGPAIRPGKS